MSEDAHGAAQDVTSAHPLTPTRLPPSAYETTYTDHSLTTARLSPAAFETDTDDSVTTTCLSPTAYEADTDHSLTTTRLSPSAYETDTNDSLTISRLSHSAYEAETDRSLTTTRLSLSACETDTDHSPTATRLSPSAYEADPDHSHAPFLHRRSREGRATHQHTVVDIPAFEGQQKCEDLDTDSDDSREPLIRIQTDFTSDKSEEEEDDDETEEEKEDSENEEEAEESENEEEEESEEEAEEEEEDQFKEEEVGDNSSNAAEATEHFSTEESVTSTQSSVFFPELKTDLLISLWPWGDWNTSQNYTPTASDDSSSELNESDENYQRNRNVNARKPRKSLWASEEEPLLIKDETGSQRRQRPKRNLSFLSRSKSAGKHGRSRKASNEAMSNKKDTKSAEKDQAKSGKSGSDEKSGKTETEGKGSKKSGMNILRAFSIGKFKKKGPDSGQKGGGVTIIHKSSGEAAATADKDEKEGEGQTDEKEGDKAKGSRRRRKSRGGKPSHKGGKGRQKRKKKDDEGKSHGKEEHSRKDHAFGLFSKQKDYPISIYFILGSEFCERFTYFGLRTILVLYLTNWLQLAKNQATAVFHLFSSLAYCSPILGAILADSYIGRYKTILYISMIYTAGCILLALTAFPPPEVYGPFIGLLLISIGTGGIKPCVVTFGGDQFERKQVKHKASFFSTFYFVINIGSLLSTVVTPLLRSDVQCVENSCYPLAFGVPAILMTLALAFAQHMGFLRKGYQKADLKLMTEVQLASGGRLPDPTTDEKKDNSKKGKHKKKKEKHKDKEDNEKRKKHKKRKKDKKRKDKKHKDKKHKDKEEKEEKGEKKGKGKPRRGRRRHGPDKSSSAKTLFEPEFVKDVKMLTRLIWLFLPLPLFWALFNQQGSRWTLQAAQLDGRFSFLGSMKPEQMQAMNPLLIILLIPVFERVIYPCMKSCSIPHKPLQRMVMGMLFCALAFVFAGLLQMKIEDNLERPVPDYMSGYTIFNTIDCKIQVRGEPLPFFQGTVPPFGQTSHKEVLAGKKMLTLYCPTTGLQTSAEANLESGKAFRLVVTALPGVLRLLVLEEKREKSTNGTAFVSFLHLLSWVASSNIKISSTRDEMLPSLITNVGIENATSFHVFEPGSYQLSFPASATQREPVTSNDWTEVGKPFEVGSGGIYTLALIDPSSSFDFADVVVEMYVDVKENSLSMILMIPQYIAMTIGEILFSISGLAFAYTQSPESMKSIIQALWLLTTSVGDLIVVLVAETRMVSDQANEFLLFAGLMVTATVVFAFMTCFYTYLDESALRRKKQGQHKGKGGKKGKRARPKRKPQGKGQKKRGGRSRGRRPSRSHSGRRGSKGEKRRESKAKKRRGSKDEEGKGGKEDDGEGSNRRRRSRRGSHGGGRKDSGHRRSSRRGSGRESRRRSRSRRGSASDRGGDGEGRRRRSSSSSSR